MQCLATGPAQPVEKNLRLTFFIAGDVALAPPGEFGEFIPARHGGVLPEGLASRNAALCKAG